MDRIPAAAREGAAPPAADRPVGAQVVVRGLRWRPHGRREPVLDDLDLAVDAGERVLLVGSSGSGKSTLLRALAGLLEAVDSGERSGSVLVDGRDPADVPGLVGLVLQEPGAGQVASTVGRDVAFGLENLAVPRESIGPQVRTALAEVGLTDAGVGSGASPATLSGGEQQRLALAGALAMAPRVLLLDEPTAMLDAANAELVRAAVDRVVTARRLTLVVVEHRLGPWLPLVDRPVVLDAAGAVTADGPPAAVLHEHAAALLAQGIWVPGAPAPTPLDITLPPLGRPAPCASAVAAARDLRVRHTTRSLHGEDRVTTALDGLDLAVGAGEALSLVGPSGSGKSTALAALGGLVGTDAGEVEVDGRARPATWTSPELAREVAWVPQWSSATLLARTVEDELLLTARAVGLPDELARARADVLVDAVGLGALRSVDPRNLSGGEQRRLAVATAAVHGPRLALADEPTVGQDRHTWAAVLGVLAALRAEGAAVVLSTHDEDVEGWSTRAQRLTAPARAPQPPRARTRVGPLSLLLAAFLGFLLPALVDGWRGPLAVLAAEVVLGVAAVAFLGRGMPAGHLARSVARRSLPALLGAATVGWSSWLLGGHDLGVAAGALLRTATMLLPSVVLLPFVDPDRLGDHLAQRLHLPARPVLAASAALQRLQSLGDLTAQLVRARRVRGIGVSRSGFHPVAAVREALAVAFGLLVGALGQASSLALAMDARGFASVRRRTWAEGAPWTRADSVVVAGGLLVVVIALLVRVVLPG